MNHPTYTFIPELKAVFTDKSLAHKLAVKVCSREWIAQPQRQFFERKSKESYLRTVKCIFGTFDNGRYEKFYFTHGIVPGATLEACGIEILGITTHNDTFRWSKKCFLTTAFLKKVCKENNIKVKTTATKQDIIKLLMKV